MRKIQTLATFNRDDKDPTALQRLTCSFPATCWGCPVEQQAQGRSSGCGVAPLGILPPEPVAVRPLPGVPETYLQESTESPRTSGNIWGAEDTAEWGDVKQGRGFFPHTDELSTHLAEEEQRWLIFLMVWLSKDWVSPCLLARDSFKSAISL